MFPGSHLHGLSLLPRFSPDIHSVTSDEDRTGVWVFIHRTSHSFLEVFLLRCILNNWYHQHIIISTRWNRPFSPLKQKYSYVKFTTFSSNQLDILFVAGKPLQILNKMLHVTLCILHKHLYQKAPWEFSRHYSNPKTKWQKSV